MRGHGLMLAQGLRAPEDWWRPAVWPEQRPALPAWLRDHVAWWQAQAVRLDREVDELTPRVEALSQGQRIPKGVGALTAALLQGEILDWHRFHNRRQGAVSKHGNPRVRHQLVEATQRLLLWQPHYPPLQQVRAATGGRARKRAVVAAARRLAVDLWRLHTGQCTAEKLGLSLAR